MTNPTPDQIRKARNKAGHTQTEAAEVLGKSMKTWQAWESGRRTMHPVLMEMYRLKTEGRV